MEKERDASRADYVSITFESQKNANKNETIIQHKNKKELCPVRSWAFIIKTVLGFSGTDENTSVNYYQEMKTVRYVTSTETLKQIRATV